MKTIESQSLIFQAERMGITVHNQQQRPPDSRGTTFPRTGEITDEDFARVEAFLAEERAVRAAAIKEAQKQAEEADARKIRACFDRRPTTDGRPEGGHRLRWISHEEQACIDCGGVWFVPDI